MAERKYVGDATQWEACLQLREALLLPFECGAFLLPQFRKLDSAEPADGEHRRKTHHDPTEPLS
ncbi:MAG: hypothetical protein IT516_17855 [Burkholderiales bacterium]|nr:hypothetical protein [Burkholderiales bacterium]